MSLRRLFLTLLATLALAGARAFADDFQQHFQTGNTYYSSGDYAKAIGEYEQVLNAGYHSPELYFNLGNACFRQGQLGLAVLYYTRAQKLDPRDDDIRSNLAFAHAYRIDKIEVSEETILLDYVNRFFDYFSLNEGITVTVILYFLAVSAILARYVYRWVYLPAPAMVLVLAIFALAVIFSAVKIDRDVATRTGVILVQQADVKNGPGAEYKSQFMAHAGLTFTIEREESGYYLVNLENRLKGWVVKSAVAEI